LIKKSRKLKHALHQVALSNILLVHSAAVHGTDDIEEADFDGEGVVGEHETGEGEATEKISGWRP